MSAIEYAPVAGLTIKEALLRAKTMSVKESKTVVANINDVIICVSSKTDVEKALQSYYQKLTLRQEIEKIKRER